MAEFSGYWTTNGAGSGDQVASYTQVHDSTASRILAACSGFEGVAPGYLNELACTDKADNTCAVNTGGAVVDGKWYINDASADVNIPSASGAGNTRIDRIVLRASWAGFDIAITRIAGTDAVSPTAPDITQTSGTTYDIQLCQVLVDTAGALTVTDERTWASYSVIYRQGGNATDWSVAGTSNYVHTKLLFQCGAFKCTVAGPNTIEFPQPFSAKPIVFVGVSGGITGHAMPCAELVTNSNFQAWVANGSGNYVKTDVFWLAVGPE